MWRAMRTHEGGLAASLRALMLLLQLSVAAAAAPTQLLFNFTSLRYNWATTLQLSEIRLYDANGVRITVSAATNPGGLLPMEDSALARQSMTIPRRNGQTSASPTTGIRPCTSRQRRGATRLPHMSSSPATITKSAIQMSGAFTALQTVAGGRTSPMGLPPRRPHATRAMTSSRSPPAQQISPAENRA